jgi:hypothetical protein
VSKYHNVVTERDGRRFASRFEASYYADLSIMLSAGRIERLRCQPRFVLQPKFTDASGIKHRAIEYVADFDYIDCDTEKWVVIECKGAETDVWKIKRKLFLFKYPQAELQIVKAR